MCEKSENRPEPSPAVGDRWERDESEAVANDAVETSDHDGLRDVLADRGRQWILRCLETAETPMALADLADELVASVADADPTTVPDERERVYVLLYHYYLPKLAESGHVSFDADRKLVDLQENAREPPLDADEANGEDRPGDGR